jgi:hypothetical protein
VGDTKHPVSLRFDDLFLDRLQKASDKVAIPKHSLCQRAVVAAVEAIEKCNYEVVMPIGFTVKSVPKKNRKALPKAAKRSATKRH